MDKLNPQKAESHQSLMDFFDSIFTRLQNMALSSAGMAIGTTSKKAVKVANTVAYLNGGEFKSKTTAEVAFTATTHDIPANANAVQEACYLVCLNAGGTLSMAMGNIASGAGNAKWPDAPSGLTPIGGVRIAIAAGATPFDASSDDLDAGHITDTYYNFGFFTPRFNSEV